jgi:SAM-dependent methyltransferase
VALKVDPSNSAQADAWDGEEGAYWATHADHFDRALGGYEAAFMRAAGISADSRVIDIGCGTGQTTRLAARAAEHGSAVGVDLSGQMIDLARQLAAREGLANVAFQQADAQIQPFAPESYDIAISRTGTMFFGDLVAAHTNIRNALRPGGTFTALVWQDPGPNEWFRELSGALAAGRDMGGPPPGAPSPFALADPDRARLVLSESGFRNVQIDGVEAPMWFGEDPEDACAFVLGLLGWMLHGLDEVAQARATNALMTTLEEHVGSDGVTFGSATWLITARV